jgi:hypothetical protein
LKCVLGEFPSCNLFSSSQLIVAGGAWRWPMCESCIPADYILMVVPRSNLEKWSNHSRTSTLNHLFLSGIFTPGKYQVGYVSTGLTTQCIHTVILFSISMSRYLHFFLTNFSRSLGVHCGSTVILALREHSKIHCDSCIFENHIYDILKQFVLADAYARAGEGTSCRTVRKLLENCLMGETRKMLERNILRTNTCLKILTLHI